MQQLKQKKIPVRRCVGCNAQRPKRELVRVVRSPEGEISIDLRGKAPGRGAYLCPSAACLAKARKAKRLERTFEVPIPDGIYDRLTEEIDVYKRQVQWCVAAVPAPGWAAKVFPELPLDEAVEKLWALIFDVCRVSVSYTHLSPC